MKTATSGAHPANTGGKLGRSGRKPAAFISYCEELLTEHRDQIGLVLANPEHKHYAAVLKIVASYACGLPTQRIEHTGEDGGPIEYLDTAKTEFQSRMDRLTARLGAAAMPEGIE